ELSGEAGRNPMNGVGDKGSRQTMERPLRTAVILPDGKKLLVLLLKANSRRDRIGNRALWTSHNDVTVFDIDLNFVWNRDRFFADSRHTNTLLINIAEHFAAKALLTGLLAGHYSMRRRNDVDSETTEYFGDLRFRH